MLSKAHIKDVCLLHGGADECRYLDDSTGVYICKKKSLEKKDIDAEVDEHLANNKNNGNVYWSPPLGDNCQGFLPLESLLQGYDVP